MLFDQQLKLLKAGLRFCLWKKKTIRKILSIATTGASNQLRDLQQNDQYYRDTIAVTANARNAGLE